MFPEFSVLLKVKSAVIQNYILFNLRMCFQVFQNPFSPFVHLILCLPIDRQPAQSKFRNEIHIIIICRFHFFPVGRQNKICSTNFFNCLCQDFHSCIINPRISIRGFLDCGCGIQHSVNIQKYHKTFMSFTHVSFLPDLGSETAFCYVPILSAIGVVCVTLLAEQKNNSYYNSIFHFCRFSFDWRWYRHLPVVSSKL